MGVAALHTYVMFFALLAPSTGLIVPSSPRLARRDLLSGAACLALGSLPSRVVARVDGIPLYAPRCAVSSWLPLYAHRSHTHLGPAVVLRRCQLRASRRCTRLLSSSSCKWRRCATRRAAAMCQRLPSRRARRRWLLKASCSAHWRASSATTRTRWWASRAGTWLQQRRCSNCPQGPRLRRRRAEVWARWRRS